MAVRDGDPASTLVCSLPVLDVRGLSFDDAAALLAGTTPGLAEPVVRSLVTASGGNPLALLDLPGQLTAAQRLGRGTVARAAARRVGGAAQVRDARPTVASADQGPARGRGRR